MNIEKSSEEDFLHVILIEQKPGFFTRFRQTLSSKGRDEDTKDDLAERLAEQAGYTERTAYSFLAKLDDHDILVQTGKEPTASGPKPVFKLDRKQLYEEIKDSEWYQRKRELWRHLLNKYGDFMA